MKPTRRTEIKETDNKRTLVLVAGWAFDIRIFRIAELDYDCIYMDSSQPEKFNEHLQKQLDDNDISSISFLGWSMGGFLALDFAARHPGLIDEVFLVSMRKRYPKELINRQKELIRKDRADYLRKFYRNCFIGHGRDFKWFKEEVMEDYIEKFSAECLIDGLDYLSEVELKTAVREQFRAKLFHGRKDNIAPLSELIENKFKIEIIEGAGHIPFLHNEFKNRLQSL